MDSTSQLQRKLQSAVEGMMSIIDRERLRPLQKATYLQMASCFDNKSASADQIESCVQNSARRIQACQNIVQNEMNQFQNRLQRCNMDCEDSIRDRNPGMNSSPEKAEKAQAQMLVCVTTCVDRHVALLKGVQQRIEAEIDSQK